MEQLGPLLPILLLVAAFYLLVLRPARARQSQQQAVVRQLAPGARVMTTSGLFGTITAVEDDQVELEIADGVRVRYVSAAIATVVDPVAPTGTSEEPASSLVEDDSPQA